MIIHLYVIINLVNKKEYYGIAKNCSRRWREHKSGHGSKLVYQAINKYGIENFKFRTLCKGKESFIKELEQIMISDQFSIAPYGYNLSEGGDGTWGVIPSEETRKKMSVSRSGKKNGMYGKQHSKETREKIRQKALLRDPSKCNLLNPMPGSSNPRALRVLVNGIEYGCIKNAAIALNITPSSLSKKFIRFHKNNNFPNGWAYLTRRG